MEAPNILILKDLDVVYPSLYDLFNQNFTNCGDKKFARIAFEYAKVSSQVDKDFHAVVIVNKIQIQHLKLDPPFLNRFEKHIINFNMLLEEKDKEIANKLYDFIRLIASFNENKDLKIDLDKLLINCEKHNSIQRSMHLPTAMLRFSTARRWKIVCKHFAIIIKRIPVVLGSTDADGTTRTSKEKSAIRPGRNWMTSLPIFP